MDSPAQQGIPWEFLQAAREPLFEVENRQERLLFAKVPDVTPLGASDPVG
jgi:hypothetical protein